MRRVIDVMGGMMDRHLTWPLLIGVVLLSSACVATVEDYESLQRDVRKLRVDVDAMKGEGFTGPEGVEGGTFRGTGMVARLEELAAESRMLQGQVEENNYRLSEIGLRLDETEIKVARLSGEPVRPGGTSRGGQAPTPSAVAPPAVPGGPTQGLPPGGTTRSGVPGQPLPPSARGPSSVQPPVASVPPQRPMRGAVPSPEKVYKDALTDYTKGNYDLAIEGFKNYLTYFPKTSLVPNAQYWLAESYYSQRKYPESIREFDKLIKTYPRSTRVPSAMLKEGYAYLELGEKSLGQGVLRELVAKFPRSREARLAQDTLEQSQ